MTSPDTEKSSSSSSPIRDDQEVAASPLINSKNHRPGRELNALVAEKVMGWKPQTPCRTEYGDTPTIEHDTGWICCRCGLRGDWGDDGFDSHFEVPRKYSTNVAAAWEVVEKVDNRNAVAKEMGVLTFSLTRYDNGYTARFFNSGATAETAPLAICLAALKAVGA